MWDLARQARLLPPFANTPVKRRPTIAAASHERSCDVDRRVLTKRGDRPLAFRAASNLIAAKLPISIWRLTSSMGSFPRNPLHQAYRRLRMPLILLSPHRLPHLRLAAGAGREEPDVPAYN